MNAPAEYRLGQIVFRAYLQVNKNGDVVKCQVQRLHIIRGLTPMGKRKAPHYLTAEHLDAISGTPYKPNVLHATSAAALEQLKNKLEARIGKLNAAMAKLPGWESPVTYLEK